MPTTLDILKAIAEHLDLSAEDLDRQAGLRDDLGLNPIELNDLLNNLSERFNITFDPEDIDNLQKVDDLVALIEDNLLE